MQILSLVRMFATAVLVFDSYSCHSAPVLTRVKQIRKLTLSESAEARPVLLRGVVTVLSGWKSSFFLQGENVGISVNREDVSPVLEPGDEVRISGITSPGKFAPVIVSKHIVVLSKQKLPTAKLFSAAELAQGRQDAQWIAIEGTIRTAEVLSLWSRPTLFLKVDIGGSTQITALVRNFGQTNPASLVGAKIRVQGVCGSIFNDRRQFVGLRLFVASLSDLHTKSAVPKTPFALPFTPLGTILQFDPNLGGPHQIKVSGVVTSLKGDHGIYLQDASGGAFVQTSSTTLPRVGAFVEAVGYSAAGQYSPKLEDAAIRVVGIAASPLPVAQEAIRMIETKDGFTSAPLDAILVRVTGKLIERVPKADETLLLLQEGPVVFAAHLPRSSGNLDSLAVGSIVSLTGVCVADEDDFHELNSFDLLLRTPADVTLRHAPPWWTPAHAGWSVALFATAVLLALGWYSLSQRQHSLRALAVTDPLTGLYNRRGFLLLAQQQWQLALRRRASLILFYIDVDHFKEINDHYGHQMGDFALRIVAKVLQESFRKADIVGRLGGDEFAVVAIDAAESSAEVLRSKISNAIALCELDGHRFRDLTLSIGVLVCDSSLGSVGFEELLSRSDTLMYQQKRRPTEHRTLQLGTSSGSLLKS